MASKHTLALAFYGDDFTGSTDALEQLTLAGVRTALFIEPPTPKQLARFKNLQAIGVAGLTRSMTPAAMERELGPALKKLKTLGARHVHYKVCSTFDSSPKIGSIGRAIDVGAEVFRASFVPVLAAAPELGRYTIFGNHFARYGIGSAGAIHRLDQHPSISKHPITPMSEADLRLHLAKQTKKRIGLFDILNVSLPADAARAALKQIVGEGAEVILFDALETEHVARIGALIDDCASARQPLFSVGSSGIEMALGLDWGKRRSGGGLAAPVKQVLVGSGSCSAVTSGQIAWALKHGFAEVPLDAAGLASSTKARLEIKRATEAAIKLINARRSVIVHTTRTGSDRRIAAKLGNFTAKILGSALGEVLRGALEQNKVRRVCVAGGDTSSYAARALGIEALEMIAPLTPGAPLCRASAPGSPADGLEVVFKGGQVGAENYFGIVKSGKA
jgi:uncharacterized protein YgbK (DUF1537 family)